jgi:dTDP-4-amino-4,6-dideoxygalactose transaminase
VTTTALDIQSDYCGSDDCGVPFARTEITSAARDAALRVLASGWVTMGPETLAFETDLAKYVGAQHAVAVSSCTAAIELSLRALGLPAGAPVLTPTLTFAGAVHAILHAGLRPVFIDADEETLVVNADTVTTAARGGAAAMVVQHMAGYPAPVSELAAAANLGLDRVVQDAAHALGSSVGETAVGALSAATCFSFYATKNLPIGEGGAVTTDDTILANAARRMRLHGMSTDAWLRYQPGGGWRYVIDDAGLKANLTDVQAAIGRAQLRHLPVWQDRRAAIAATYDSLLADVPGVATPPRPRGGRHAWHLYIIRVLPACPLGRDALAEELASRRIGTSVHFIPVHQQPYFRRVLGAAACDELPVADGLFPQLLSLPMHPRLTDQDIERVCSAVSDLCRSTGRVRSTSAESARSN